jgi:thiol-disulfide isomerase/thioredoxin
LSDFQGKTVLLEFWASWCPGCRADAPKLAALYPSLREKGVEIIAVNVNDETTDFRNFLAAFDMPWTHARENAEGRLQKMFRANAFPTYYLIDADGMILASRIKSRDLFAEIEKRLNK